MTAIPDNSQNSKASDRNEGFAGLRVLALESRRAKEIAQLIANSGGQAIMVPSTRDVPTGSNAAAIQFTSGILNGRFHAIIFLTGAGTRILFQQSQQICPLEQLVSALKRVVTIARGPKSVSALREAGVRVNLFVPEPNTWREVLQTLDENPQVVLLSGSRVAVQEYGVSSPELLAGLSERGAEVFPVRVYQWALPEDLEPLEEAVRAISRGDIDVVLFTASVQIDHLLQIAVRMNLQTEVIAGLAQSVVGSIGPITSDEARRNGIAVDVEPEHPRMGFLIKETADRAIKLLREKRATDET